MIPAEAPWPTVYSGVDARRGPWPTITHGADLLASSWPYWSKARYSDAADEWGTGSIKRYVRDGLGYARAAWDAARPGGWMVLNLGDTRVNTGGAGRDVAESGQRVYRQDRSHGIEGQQWGMIPELAARAVRTLTPWQLSGKVVWRKPTATRSDHSAYHLRRNRRPGLQHEMVYLFWKPGGRQTFNADALLFAQDPAAVVAADYLDRLRDVLAKLPPSERAVLRRSGALPTTEERRAIKRLSTPGVKSVLGDVWDLPKHTSEPPWAETSDDVKSWPDALCERLVLLLTDPGDLVVDPCAGYGSIVRAAEYHGRRGTALDLYWGRTPLPSDEGNTPA